MASRRAENAEKRARRQEARAKVAQLRARLREALATKARRLREITHAIREERKALRERLQDNRKRYLEELRKWERDQRAMAREEWKRKRLAAKDEAAGAIERVRAELAAERAHEAEQRRITREAAVRVEKHANRRQSDDEVRALIPTALIPFFERLKRALGSGRSQSRAEAFLAAAVARPDDLFKFFEPRVEQMIAETMRELARTERVATGNVVAFPGSRGKPANGNAIPAPANVRTIGSGSVTQPTATKRTGRDAENDRLAAIDRAYREKLKTLKAPEVRELKDLWDPLESTCRHASLSIL